MARWWCSLHGGFGILAAGKQFRESAKTDNYDEAERMLKRRQGEIATGAFTGLAPERIRVSQLLQEMLDDMKANGRRSYGSAEGGVRLHLVPFMGNVRVADFSSNLVKAYKAKRQVEKAANATINRELGLLKRAFNLAYRAEPPLVAKVPYISRLPNAMSGQVSWSMSSTRSSGTHSPITLSSSSYSGITRALASANCGASRGRRLRRIASCCIRERPKTETAALFPSTAKWPDGLRWPRRAVRQFPKCPYLCQHDGQPLGDSCVKKAWKTACKSVGLPELRFHDLRRSAVRNMDRAGVPRTVAMKVSGHKTESMFNRYNIVSERDVAEVKNRMETYLSSLGISTLSSTLSDSEPASGTQAPPKSLN